MKVKRAAEERGHEAISSRRRASQSMWEAEEGPLKRERWLGIFARYAGLKASKQVGIQRDEEREVDCVGMHVWWER